MGGVVPGQVILGAIRKRAVNMKGGATSLPPNNTDRPVSPTPYS